MRKIFFVTLLVLCAGQIEAYNYQFNNKTDHEIRVCVRFTTGSACRSSSIPAHTVGELNFGMPDARAGLCITSATASLPNGESHTEVDTFTSSAMRYACGNQTFTVHPEGERGLRIEHN